jgi:hypothetical protein
MMRAFVVSTKVGKLRLEIRGRHYQSTLARQFHFAEIGVGAEQSHALLALSDETTVESRHGFLLERPSSGTGCTRACTSPGRIARASRVAFPL